MNIKSMLIAGVTMACMSAAPAMAERGLVLTWQNSAGYWFACGPVQCIQGGEKTEKEAMDLVLQKHHSESYHDQFGKCTRYIVTAGMQSWDNSAEKVERLAKCF